MATEFCRLKMHLGRFGLFICFFPKKNIHSFDKLLRKGKNSIEREHRMQHCLPVSVFLQVCDQYYSLCMLLFLYIIIIIKNCNHIIGYMYYCSYFSLTKNVTPIVTYGIYLYYI